VDSNPLSRALEGTDPLTQFARQDEELNDPLSQIVSEFVSKRGAPERNMTKRFRIHNRRISRRSVANGTGRSRRITRCSGAAVDWASSTASPPMRNYRSQPVSWWHPEAWMAAAKAVSLAASGL